MHAPKPATTRNSVGPARRRTGRRARKSAERTSRPREPRGASRARSGRPRGCPSRRSGGVRRHRRAGPRRGRARSRRAGRSSGGSGARRRGPPRDRRRLPPRRTRPRTDREDAPESDQREPDRDPVDELRLEREEETADRGPGDSESWNAIERWASALTRISRGTSDGVSARPAGAPIALATPIANASTKNGQPGRLPATRDGEEPEQDADSTATMKR